MENYGMRKVGLKNVRGKIMIQHIITYILVAVASGYVIYRNYENIKKQKSCGKCELMKAAKMPKNTTS